MVDKIKVLIGFNEPLKDNPIFLDALKRANDAADPKKFIPCKNRKREVKDE